MWDAQLTGLDNLNEDWNGIWQVVTNRDPISWSAEFAIPLRTLRFNPGNDIIGFNVRRVIRRKNEEDLWRSWGRAQGLNNLVYTADIGGFSGIRGDRPIEVRPYALARLVTPSYDSVGTRIAPADNAGKAGIDAKLAVSPTMTADLTVNTDFAQVEADQQVINLTRFPTFFPEKREFFLESSGLFDIGTPGRTQLFYSRRIGLDSTGAAVPILGGARVYGKAGLWGIGLLDVRTGGSEQANDAVLRLSHDLLERSTIVGMLVDRSYSPSRNERGAGVDLDFPLVLSGYNVEPHFWAMATRTGAAPGTPLAWRVSTDVPNDLFDSFVSLYSIDSDFNPTMGFVRRTGIWETTGHIDFQPRPRVLGIRRLDLTPIPSWDIITDRHNTLTDASTWQTADFEWHALAGDLQSGDHFELNVRRELDAPSQAFGTWFFAVFAQTLLTQLLTPAIRLFGRHTPGNHATGQALLLAQLDPLIDERAWLLVQPLAQVEGLTSRQEDARSRLQPRQEILVRRRHGGKHFQVEVPQVSDPQRTRAAAHVLPTGCAIGAAAGLDFHVRHCTATQVPFGLQLHGCCAAPTAAAATGIFLLHAVRQRNRGTVQYGNAAEAFKNRCQGLVRTDYHLGCFAKEFLQERSQFRRKALLDGLRSDLDTNFHGHLGQFFMGCSRITQEPQDKRLGQRLCGELPFPNNDPAGLSGFLGNLAK